MQPIFELWDTETRNLVDAYATEEAALEEIRFALEVDGPQSVETLVLLRDDRNNAPLTPIARGAVLAEYARNMRARAAS